MNKDANNKKRKNLLSKLNVIFISIVCFLGALFIIFREQILDAYNKYNREKNISANLDELENHEDLDKLLQVHFIDVGQGDATLITYNGHAMLIDGGDNSKGTAIQKYLKDLDIDNLDYVIGTHPDEDHIGGLDVIVYKFNCKNIILPNIGKDTKSYEELIMSIEEKKYEITYPVAGSEFYMDDIKFTILSPQNNYTYEELNDYSIVLKMEYKDISFIFAGDAGEIVMKQIMEKPYNLQCQVYKVAHHGSGSSYNEDFYKKMSPAYMIVSCGRDNDYNHPHKEITDYAKDNDVILYRTDQDGNIVAYSDGKKIAWITE